MALFLQLNCLDFVSFGFHLRDGTLLNIFRNEIAFSRTMILFL